MALDARSRRAGRSRIDGPGAAAAGASAAAVVASAAISAAAGAIPPIPPWPASTSSSAEALGPASAASYSGTVAKTGSPAEAARARDAASPAITDSRRLLTSASRERSRKLILDVAMRDPYGTTSATFVPGADRIRDAADVISSSTSR